MSDLDDSVPEVFYRLFSEISPDKIMWRLSTGQTYTAAQLAAECRNKTDIGREYMSDALRVTRDLIYRQANKK
jgi:hypothetical protein